jgi:ribosomal-protein-alanine N-acetyltransferase
MKAETAGTAIRPMRAADLDQVMEIAGSLSEAPRWPRTAYLKALDPESTPRRIALVAEESETAAAVGFLVASLLTPQAELESIAVSAREQRRGIGRNLVSAAVEELGALGVREVLLEVRASNLQALGFYRSLGWSETGRRKRYYAEPEEDAVLLRLSLE